MIKPFMNGEKVRWNDTELELSWVRKAAPASSSPQRCLQRFAC
ncbi:MAG TPA: hypothetical protein VI122_12520 [Thermoleophilaceae bacterium]|jgi:hypothetical protein